MFLVGGYVGEPIACIKIRYFLPEYLRTLKKKELFTENETFLHNFFAVKIGTTAQS